MNLLKYILLGIIQGITEPLPISSSGHIFIIKQLFKTNMFNDLNFEIFVNFASFIAILIIFWKDVIKIITGFLKYLFNKEKKYYNDYKYALLILISSIPVGLIGVLFKDSIENILNRTWIVGIMFIITGFALLLVKNKDGKKSDYEITYKDALIIGLLYIFALFPGLSRSGILLVACLLCNFNKETSLKYTFILYFPISLGTIILGVKDILDVGIDSAMFSYYLIGMIFAFIFTYLTYKVLSSIVKNGKLWKFSIYLFITGILTLLYFI